MKKSYYITIHLSIILVLGIFILFPLTFQASLPKEFWIKQAYQTCIWLFIFYLNIYVMVPQLLFRGKTIPFIIILLALVYGSTQLAHWIGDVYDVQSKAEHVMSPDSGSGGPRFNTISDFIQTVVTLLLLVIGTSLKVGERLQSENIQKQSLEREKVLTELSFLKAQINPHFFFNVLHAIYALTETNIIKAQDAIYTLSQMMRYVLYDTSHHTTTLSKEFSFLENYIKLMKLRIPASTELIFEKPAVVQDVPLAPMLFLPFVENAFKHGVSPDHAGTISIIIRQHGKVLELEVQNPVLSHKAENMEESNGIGLANTRRRLDILYPGKYELTAGIQPSVNKFVVHLKLEPA